MERTRSFCNNEATISAAESVHIQDDGHSYSQDENKCYVLEHKIDAKLLHTLGDVQLFIAKSHCNLTMHGVTLKKFIIPDMKNFISVHAYKHDIEEVDTINGSVVIPYLNYMRRQVNALIFPT